MLISCGDCNNNGVCGNSDRMGTGGSNGRVGSSNVGHAIRFQGVGGSVHPMEIVMAKVSGGKAVTVAGKGYSGGGSEVIVVTVWG